MKWKHLVFTLGIALMVCMAWTGVVRAEMVETNVAYMKTVYNHPYGATYFKPPTHYSSWEPVLVDDIFYNDSPANFLYVNRNVDAIMRIDLTGEEGVTTNINSVHIVAPKCTAANWAPYLQDCFIEAGPTTACDAYSIEIPAATLESAGALRWKTSVDWTGVRYIRVRDDVDNGGDDDLTMTEMRVRASVPGYETFIGNVTVGYDPAKSYEDNLFAEPESMVNNAGMTDQGGAGVGDPTAKSISTAGNYFCNPASGDPVLVFDLHGEHALDEMLVWNYSWATLTGSNNNRGTKEVTLEYSDNGGTTWTTLANTNGDDPGTHTFAVVPEEPNDTLYRMYDYQTAVDFGGVTATHVRMTQLSDYGGGLRGLAEVRFYEVPEPTTLAGLIALGLLCLVGRYRR